MNAATQKAKEVPQGRFTLVYPDGQYRTMQIKQWSGPGRLVVYLKNGREWEACGFALPALGRIAFWKRFAASTTPERLERIQRAFSRIMEDPEKAGMAYAMQENRCYRCGRELVVPASIHKGMGPECARRNVTKKLNREAYDWRASQAKKITHHPDEAEMDQMVVSEEQRQERIAFLSDPDYRNSVRENCEQCKSGSPVDHFGSPRCRSGSIASGGHRAHCTCDTCF